MPYGHSDHNATDTSLKGIKGSYLFLPERDRLRNREIIVGAALAAIFAVKAAPTAMTGTR